MKVFFRFANICDSNVLSKFCRSKNRLIEKKIDSMIESMIIKIFDSSRNQSQMKELLTKINFQNRKKKKIRSPKEKYEIQRNLQVITISIKVNVEEVP